MFLKTSLEFVSDIDISKIDKSTLIDINTIHIDPLQPFEKRMKNYLEQIKNPYCFLCDGSVVKINFNQNTTILKNKLRNYYISKKECY